MNESFSQKKKLYIDFKTLPFNAFNFVSLNAPDEDLKFFFEFKLHGFPVMLWVLNSTSSKIRVAKPPTIFDALSFLLILNSLSPISLTRTPPPMSTYKKNITNLEFQSFYEI